MGLSVTTSETQIARDKLQQELKKFVTGKFVTVGIQENAGDHEGGDITNAHLGATLHFGAEIKTKNGKTFSIPARPWLDVGVQSGVEDYNQLIQGGIEDGLPIDQILEQIGVVAVAAVQGYMTELNAPPNAPSTIAKKGSSNPLIDTGALRQSITYKIENGKPQEGLD